MCQGRRIASQVISNTAAAAKVFTGYVEIKACREFLSFKSEIILAWSLMEHFLWDLYISVID